MMLQWRCVETERWLAMAKFYERHMLWNFVIFIFWLALDFELVIKYLWSNFILSTIFIFLYLEMVSDI